MDKEKIKSLIEQNKIKDAIVEFKKYELEQDIYDELVLISSRYTEIKSKERKNIVNVDELNIENNKIRIALLHLLDSINTPSSIIIRKVSMIKKHYKLIVLILLGLLMSYITIILVKNPNAVVDTDVAPVQNFELNNKEEINDGGKIEIEGDKNTIVNGSNNQVTYEGDTKNFNITTNYEVSATAELKEKISNKELNQLKLGMHRKTVEELLGIPHKASERCINCFSYDYKDISIDCSYEDNKLYDIIMVRTNVGKKWTIPMYEKCKEMEQEKWNNAIEYDKQSTDLNINPKTCKFGEFNFYDVLAKFQYLTTNEAQTSWDSMQEWMMPHIYYYTNGGMGGTSRPFAFSELYERFQGDYYDVVFVFGTTNHTIYYEAFSEDEWYGERENSKLTGKELNYSAGVNKKILSSPIEYIALSKVPIRAEEVGFASGDNIRTFHYFMEYYYPKFDDTHSNKPNPF